MAKAVCLHPPVGRSGDRAGWRAWRGLAAAVAGTVMLAGCQTSQYSEIQQTGSLRAYRASDRFPIAVEPGEVQLRIEAPGFARGLTPRQREQAGAFLADYRSLGEGEIVVSVPSGTANEIAAMAAVTDLRAMMGEAGIAKTAIRYVPLNGEGGGTEPPLLVSFERYFANPTPCGHWPRNLAHEPYNKPYANFGCATQNNLAAIVADPRDLVGHRPLSPGDAARRHEVFDQYRTGDVTSAERSTAESGATSEVQE